MAKADIEARTERLLEPITSANSFELVDVEYVKEGTDWFLRAYIDKEGGITIDDCELVSRALEVKLDEEDFIPDAYILEISSPGLTRPLKKDKDFKRNMGKDIEIHLYKAIDKCKEFVGTLSAFDDTQVTIDIDDEKMTFNRKDCAIIRQYIEF